MKSSEIRLKDILEWINVKKYNYKLSKEYDPNYVIDGPNTTVESGGNNVSFSTDAKSDAGILFSKKGAGSMITVLTENPKLDFVKCITEFFPPMPCKVVRGKNVEIGLNCSIGGEGFGYVKDHEDGSWIKFPHYGNVILGDNVTIGDNNTITRGTLGDTVIGDGVKTDCGVHIAHNSVIGKNCMFAAHAMVAGSVVMGENCWVGPSAMIMNKLVIGKDVFIGIGSNVIKDVPDGVVVAGNPAKIIRENKGLLNSVK